RSLAAYITTSQGSDIDLKDWLKARLPDYMVPGSFTLLDHLPLTPNGKVDRNALPAPDVSTVMDDAPLQTDTEHQVAAIWSEVLQHAITGAQSHFFELGGNSLLIAQVHARLRTTWPGITMADLFHYPTIRALASHLDQVATDQSPPDNTAQADAAQSRAAQRRAQQAARQHNKKR
ncbi:MAG: phosphopantetheine-binding protein, partial [Pseudomonadota bacterium]